MKLINSGLSRDITEKIDLLSAGEGSEVALSCRKLIEKKIRESARANSFKIEYPSSNSVDFLEGMTAREFMKEGKMNLDKAYKWGRDNFDLETLDESFVRSLNYNILPRAYFGEIATYRDTRATIAGSSVIPPSPEKIRDVEMPNFISSLKQKLGDKDPINRIKAAIYTHFHLSRIQAFQDGNKRTARTFQDLILEYSRIPVPIIDFRERDIYFELLNKASSDWKSNQKSLLSPNDTTEGENLFYTFMAGKINSSLDNVLEKCISEGAISRKASLRRKS